MTEKLKPAPKHLPLKPNDSLLDLLIQFQKNDRMNESKKK